MIKREMKADIMPLIIKSGMEDSGLASSISRDGRLLFIPRITVATITVSTTVTSITSMTAICSSVSNYQLCQ